VKLIAATRKSQLALWQTNYVIQKLTSIYKGIEVELNEIQTKGDLILDKPLNEIGGKSLFMKELEVSMLNKESDFAVHSLKDVPYEVMQDFKLVAYCERENPHDALVSKKYPNLKSLPPKSTIGTSSLRRRAQLLKYRPDLNIIPLRGNVQTRLKKLDSGEYDGIVLAAAGLIRLNQQQRISEYISKDICLPAVGQGVIVIEAHQENSITLDLLKSINHALTERCIIAERSFNKALEGGCHVPIAAHAEINPQSSKILLTGFVSCSEGKQTIQDSITGYDPETIGSLLAEKFIKSGAKSIINV
jgi:hydroxymethylbilane synthase